MRALIAETREQEAVEKASELAGVKKLGMLVGS
jgi:hypothetical protein